MKKILKKIMAISLCFLLTGCVKVEMDVKIKTNKKADVIATMKVAESLLGSSGEEIDLNDEQFKEVKDAGAKLSVEEIDGAKWLVIETKSKDINLEKSLEIKNGMMYLNVNKLSEEKAISNTTSKLMDSDTTDENADNDINDNSDKNSDNSLNNFPSNDMGMLEEYMNMLDIQYRITMPNKPDAKIGKIEGNTVILNTENLMQISENDELGIISCRASRPFFIEPWFLSICGICAGGAIALLVVSKIKSKKRRVETKEN